MIDEGKIQILLVTDIHDDYEYLKKLKKWQIENNIKVDYIFCTGDIVTTLEQNNDKAINKCMIGLLNIIKFLEQICSKVIYIGGNYDPIKIYEKNNKIITESINLHKDYFKIKEDLYVLGVGGFENTDKKYLEDLDYTLNKFKNNIKEKDVKLILLTHNGPYYSNTTLMEYKNKCLYSGSKTLQHFLKINNDIIINIHGHTHGGKGITNFNKKSVINVGNLSDGHFGIIELRRNINYEWFLYNCNFICLN
jgi:Icc-related predicted phosphoesterase